MQRLRHIDEVTSSESNAIFAKAKYVFEFVRQNYGHIAIPQLFDALANSHRKSVAVHTPSSWLVIPFHPAYERAGFGAILESFRKDWPPSVMHVFPRISWSSSGVNLERSMQQHLEKILEANSG